MSKLAIIVAICSIPVSLSAAAGQTVTTQPAATQPAPFVSAAPDGQQIVYARGLVIPSPQFGITQVQPEDIGQQYSAVLRLDVQEENVGRVYYGGFPANNDSASAAALLTSTALIDPAARQALGFSSQQRQSAVVVNVYPVGSRLARLEVILRKSANGNYAEGDAGKLAGALVERLKVAYAESASAARKAAVARRDPLEKELKSVQQRADELRARQQEIHSALSINGNMYAYSGNASYQLNNIRSQRKSLQTELVRNQARLQTLEPASGPLVAQWADIVKVRQKHLDELKKASDDKKPSDEELREAENKLTDAVAQLAAAKQVQPTDGMNVQFRANEIANLHSSIADEEDRIKQMDAQIAKLQDPKFQQQLERLPEMQNEESRLRSQSMELQNQLDQVRRASQEEGAVIVTVLDGQAH